jgi:AcrR family transcriptional regulator
MSGSSGSPRKNVNGATTMQTLISFGLEELKRSGSTDFNLETVLRESGVSRGSLYHHFGSRLGLITHCEAQLLKDTLKAENETIRALIESSASGVELFEVLALFIRTLGSPALVHQRSRRIRTLATSVDDKELRATLASQQVKGSQFLIDSFQIAVDKGQIQPRVPLAALVYLMQSLFLGRILVDITEDRHLSDDWNEAVIESLRHAINPQP